MLYELLSNHPATILIISTILLKLSYKKYNIIFNFIAIAGPVTTLIKFCFFENLSAIYLFNFTILPIHYHIYNKILGISLLSVHCCINLYALSNKQHIEIMIGNLLAVASLIALLANDFISLFFGLELMMICSTITICIGDDPDAKAAAFRYFLMHIMASIILLSGIILVTDISLVRTIISLTANIDNIIDGEFTQLSLGSALIMFSLLINLGAPPFSAWLADSYPTAKTSGTVYLSLYTTKIAAYYLIKLFTGCKILFSLGLFMMFYGCIYSILANNLRRIYCYQNIMQLGAILIIISFDNIYSNTSAILILSGQIIYGSLMLMIIGLFIDSTKANNATDINIVPIKMGLLFSCGIICLLSMINIPYSCNFFAKITMGHYIHEYNEFAYVFYSAMNSLILIAVPWQQLSRATYLESQSLHRFAVHSLRILTIAVICSGFVNLFLLKYISNTSVIFTDNLIKSQLLMGLITFILTLRITPLLPKKNNIILDFDYFYRILPYRLASNLTIPNYTYYQHKIVIYTTSLLAGIKHQLLRVTDVIIHFHSALTIIILSLIIMIFVTNSYASTIHQHAYTNYNDINKHTEKNMNASIKIPKAARHIHTIQIHDTVITDPYQWLRDPSWPTVETPAILDYLKAENSYRATYFAEFADQQTAIFNELKGRIKLTDQSVAIKRDDYFYYTRTLETQDYPIFCRKKNVADAVEEILLDQNILAIGKSFCNIGAFSISPDHRLLAYSVDENGGERFEIRVFDLTSNKYLTDVIPNIVGDIVWHEQLNGFFYTPTTEQWRHDKIYFHYLNTPVHDDILVYHELDQLYSVNVHKASSKDYIFVNITSHAANEYHFIAMADHQFQTQLVDKRRDQHFYDMDHCGSYFYIHTNDQGKNFRIARAAVTDFQSNAWQDYVSHDSHKYLKSFDLTANYLILNYKDVGLPNIIIVDLANKNIKNIVFPDQLYTASASSTNFYDNDIRINYSSLKRPDSILHYDYPTATLTTLKTKEIPTGFTADDYEVTRLWATSGDVKVPISVIYKKSLFKNDGSNPLYLYGYGSYGYAVPANFRSSIFSLIDRGFVYAIAHVRGGDDLGFEWYESAKFLGKKHSFADFIACAEQLIKENYTRSGHITIAGGSAGGMLIGNVINDRPELFKIAIAHVPFVDVVNTMLDATLPLTPGEYKEWGNPQDKIYFNYMLSYSPYENIKPQAYPHIFATAGLTDPRVGYWEAAKWIASLRAQKTDDNLIFLKTNMSAGHQGASGRFDYLKEIAEEIAYILYIYNLQLYNI